MAEQVQLKAMKSNPSPQQAPKSPAPVSVTLSSPANGASAQGPQGLLGGPQGQKSPQGLALEDNKVTKASDIESMEQIEALIQMKKLPPETVTIHSPESGTTIF